MTDIVAVRAKITGRVQGVWFRAWTQSEAQKRGLNGWVRNESNGAVSALVCGPQAEVTAFIALLHRGPPDAKVAQVETEPADAADCPDSFDIRR